MKKFYVIGSKASSSLSPTIFNYWFKKYKINAKYGFIEVNKENFDIKIKKLLKEENLSGLNITIPFKKTVIKHTNALDTHSKKINAVNCLVINSKIKGHNTDWQGYYKTIPKANTLKNKNILLIGYGGAALAIHYVLKKKGFKNITIINRTKKKLRYEKKTTYTKNLSQLSDYLADSDLIINSTSINPIDKNTSKLVSPKAILSDIVYKPKETKFLKSFPENKKIYGIYMLLEQAVPCFEMWLGFKPTIDDRLIKILDKKIT